MPGSAEVLGRYVVLDRLGEGGMGIVHRAYDPALHREVALKVLRVVGPKSAHDRLFREAQALARVTHPHVVTVYDVGAVGADVFVAMELIRGSTLRAWLSRPRELAEILEVCIAAGEGLAAAHAAGLVHRDFKPSNVMVGDDGRVRVLDFGLARPTGEVAAAEPVSGDLLASPITQEGAIVGTPQYMSPEQRRGEAADARSDQYSFCLVLREALDASGASSTTATSATPIGDASDEERSAPKLAGVPRAVRAAIARGLADDPAKRFPSMRELLDEIAPQRRRVWIATAAVLGVVIAGGAIALASSSSAARPCAQVATPFEQMWSVPAREALHAGFLEHGGPLAETMWERAAPLIDGWGTQWIAARRATCEATHVRGEQSADLLDRRMACLDDRRRELGGVLDSFAAADPDIALAAVKLVRGVDPVGGCADTKAVLDQPPVPPLLRTQIEAATREVDALAALTHAKKTDVVQRAQRALDVAKTLGYAPLEAAAHYQLGEAQINSGAYAAAATELQAAALAADRGRDDRARAKSWLERMYVQGGELQRGSDALATRDLASSALSRVPGDVGKLPAELELYTADAYQALGKNDEALKIIDGMLAEGLASKRDPHDDLRGLVLTRKALLLDALDRWSETMPILRETQSIYEAVYGTDHPIVAGVMSNEANAILMTRGNYTEAEQLYRRALAIEEGAFGTDSPQAALYANNIVNLFLREERFADAEPFARRAVDIRTRKLGDHPLTARAVINLAMILTHLGKADEAEALFQRGFAIQKRTLAPGVYDFAYAHQLHGEALFAFGHPAEASAELADAYARFHKLFGDDNGAVNEALAKWARAEALAGDPKSAIEHADQVIKSSVKNGDRYFEARGRWSRAEGLAAQGRAAEAATEIQRGLARLDADPDNPDAPRLAAQLKTWLAAHTARR